MGKMMRGEGEERREWREGEGTPQPKFLDVPL